MWKIRGSSEENYKNIENLANFKTILRVKGSNERMHGKCLNYKVVYKSGVVLIFI